MPLPVTIIVPRDEEDMLSGPKLRKGSYAVLFSKEEMDGAASENEREATRQRYQALAERPAPSKADNPEAAEMAIRSAVSNVILAKDAEMLRVQEANARGNAVGKRLGNFFEVIVGK